MAGKTSFQKKTRGKFLQIPGTRPSLHNNQLLVSTGVPSLDNVIGGGLAVGTVLLVEEDTFGSYSRILLKYYLAEGIMCKQSVFLASADVEPENIIKDLPGPIIDDPGKDQVETTGDNTDSMKIAWRYENQPKYQSNPNTLKFGHYYDMTKTMDPSLLSQASQHMFYLPEEDVSIEKLSNIHIANPSYARLIEQIQQQIQQGQYSTSQTQAQQRNILRIGIHSLGSPQWGEEGGVAQQGVGMDPSLPRFLYALRALLRSAFAVCLLTVPTHLFHDAAFTRRVEKLSDTVIALESFAGSDKEKNPAFKEYHGLFHIRQLPRLNSLLCHMPDTLDLAFKLKRKKFTIEKLHLPPELQDSAQREQDDPVTAAMSRSSCGSGTGTSKLDF